MDHSRVRECQWKARELRSENPVNRRNDWPARSTPVPSLALDFEFAHSHKLGGQNPRGPLDAHSLPAAKKNGSNSSSHKAMGRMGEGPSGDREGTNVLRARPGSGRESKWSINRLSECRFKNDAPPGRRHDIIYSRVGVDVSDSRVEPGKSCSKLSPGPVLPNLCLYEKTDLNKRASLAVSSLFF